ncbi:MarR family winged helix-turn-helix transcriptional regulator [Cellulomonas cellasea]|uniref:MarR family winged helix-turn-helix transcriptional regulator n=1 Tax=Cellulomonas cellasea TaxID=43670 RepID=UPI0027D96926|nr:MarR family transcriptional regulator [Cellulomonas cellasea]
MSATTGGGRAVSDDATTHSTRTRRSRADGARPDAPPPGADEDVPGALEAMICFDIYSASRNLTSVYRPLLDALGLTYPQYLVMRVLWCQGERTVRELVDEIQLDYGTLSPLLKRLEAAGLVDRRRRADDERSVLVSLTAKGAELQERSTQVPDAIGAALDLTPEESADLRRLLHKVSANTLRAAH